MTDAAPQAAPTSSTLRTADDESLALTDWPLGTGAPGPAPAPATAARGTVLIVHGLGEHAGRYAPLARWLNGRGYAVRAYDLYGHGSSSGRRGHLARETQHLEHLVEVAAATRATHARGSQPAPGATGGASPLIVLGHSLGGLIASSAVARGLLKPEGLVLSSPALAVDMAAWQRAAVGWLPRFAPDLTLGNGLQPRYLSHDPTVVAAYEADPLVHDRICARLGAFVATEGGRVVAAAARWPVRTLLLYAGDDRLVAPRGSDAFAAAAAGGRAGAAAVTAQRFAALYHEIFNERDAAPVLKALADWLDAKG
jgi:alpha-beta hydrolase superfamily lysophospholipase